MKEKLLVSFSGGETSAFMTWWILNKWEDRDNWNIIVVFANTGQENEETLEFVNKCDKKLGFNSVWIEAIVNPIHGKGNKAKIVTFESASRNGEPFEAVISKHGIPNVSTPHCSRELKKYPIRQYARSIGWKNYQTAIGIRSDEIDRISKDYKKEKIVYPLISWCPFTKQKVNEFWSKQSFRLKLKGYQGNCKTCWKKALENYLQ